MPEILNDWRSDSDNFVHSLFEWLQEAGRTLYDPGVTQLEHGLQCAHLAAVERAPAEEILAALLHDIGHLLAGEHSGTQEFLARDLRHEVLGANWLAPRFGEAVAAPVRLHVTAKRYLCATEPSYWEALSSASKRSLTVQGGPMNDPEVQAFRTLPGHEAAVALRRRDDRAKHKGVVVPELSTHSPLVRSLLT